MTSMAARVAARPRTRATLRQLWEIIAPQSRLLAVSLALLLVHSACRLAQPWLVMLAIDRHLLRGNLDGFWTLTFGFLGIVPIAR